MDKNTGGSAFPFNKVVPHEDGYERVVPCDGLTIRDYFAAKALQGLLANPFVAERDTAFNTKDLAKWAHMLADEMLKAREA